MLKKTKRKQTRKKKFKVSTYKKKLHKLWSEAVRERDGGLCQWCGKPGHHAHHIVARGMGLAGNMGSFDIHNGMTLCYRCHMHKLHCDIDGYKLFRDEWLLIRGLEYMDMRIGYGGCRPKFDQEFYTRQKESLEKAILKYRGRGLC